MKIRNFFTHTGIVLGYFALFFVVQLWAGNLFMTGESFGLIAKLCTSSGFLYGAFDQQLLSLRISEALMQTYWDFSDVVILLTYFALAGLFSAFLYAEHPDRPLAAAHIQKPRSAVMLWAPVVLGLGLFYAVQAGMMLIPEDAPVMQDYIEAVSSLECGKWPWLSFVVTVLGAPLVEEVLFRGLIYKHLKKAMPAWLALIVQAVLFGLAHGQILWMAFTFVLAVALGLMCDYFDSLWPCIIVHLCFNASNYLPFPFEPDAVGWLIVLFSALLVCAVVLLVLILYRQNRPIPAQE